MFSCSTVNFMFWCLEDIIRETSGQIQAIQKVQKYHQLTFY